jgi:L-threonylcarbamoyladenylate synthase
MPPNHLTRRLFVSSTHPDPALIAEAAGVIQAGGLVAFPTETVYGLGANALDPDAVQRVFSAKGRPAHDPLIIHLCDPGDLLRVAVAVPPVAERLAVHFWPGPLTLIVPRAPAVPLTVSAGRETVAVRIPQHAVAVALIRAAGTPIVAPSANRFGHTSPTTADHVLADLDGRIDRVLDSGPTPIGLESTVLDVTTPHPRILRPGAISVTQLSAVIGPVELGKQQADEQAGLVSPGMLERHYAPETELWFYIGPPESGLAWMRERIELYLARGQSVGLLVTDEDAEILTRPGVDVERLGSADQIEQVAQRLYAALRALDARCPAVILARDFGEEGLALAIRDRLTKAASGRVAGKR